MTVRIQFELGGFFSLRFNDSSSDIEHHTHTALPDLIQSWECDGSSGGNWNHTVDLHPLDVYVFEGVPQITNAADAAVPGAAHNTEIVMTVSVHDLRPCHVVSTQNGRP